MFKTEDTCNGDVPDEVSNNESESNDLESAQLLDNEETNEDKPSHESPEVTSEHNPKDMKVKKKKFKRGIVYLSTIPPFMSVTKLRQLMSEFGQVGRVFLQPQLPKDGKKKKKKTRIFTEGWVEFLKKRVAKAVALNLNNQLIGGKKTSRYHDYLWNIKYLPRFKWIHLSERLAYERAVLRQRMRTEISQAKRIASHFAQAVERSGKLPKQQTDEETPTNVFHIPDARPNKKKKRAQREQFLKSIFA